MNQVRKVIWDEKVPPGDASGRNGRGKYYIMQKA